MSSKKDNVINYLENALSILKAKNIDEPKWYEREPFQKTICWVSDESKNPKEDGTMEIITDYDETALYSFRLNSTIGYKYAEPLANSEEIIKLILEDQKNEQQRRQCI